MISNFGLNIEFTATFYLLRTALKTPVGDVIQNIQKWFFDFSGVDDSVTEAQRNIIQSTKFVPLAELEPILFIRLYFLFYHIK